MYLSVGNSGWIPGYCRGDQSWYAAWSLLWFFERKPMRTVRDKGQSLNHKVHNTYCPNQRLSHHWRTEVLRSQSGHEQSPKRYANLVCCLQVPDCFVEWGNEYPCDWVWIWMHSISPLCLASYKERQLAVRHSAKEICTLKLMDFVVTVVPIHTSVKSTPWHLFHGLGKD